MQVVGASIPFSHINFAGSTVRKLHAIEEVEEVVEEELPGSAFVLSRPATDYLGLKVLEQLITDMVQSTGLTLLAVFLATLLLTADAITSVLSTVSVTLTVVATAGLAHFWALDLDFIVAILLTITAGLSVDYTTHVGLTFLNQAGDSRNGRVCATLAFSGPHVLHGGLSTLLGVFPLWFISPGLHAFVKIYLLLVVLGLFHALLLLPTLLTYLGPRHTPPSGPTLQPAAGEGQGAPLYRHPIFYFWLKLAPMLLIAKTSIGATFGKN